MTPAQARRSARPTTKTPRVPLVPVESPTVKRPAGVTTSGEKSRLSSARRAARRTSSRCSPAVFSVSKWAIISALPTGGSSRHARSGSPASRKRLAV
ncbi:hypothetical protein [Deinococcus gobiensis]|uniref:hypothetical protein n=1 Tax=Deinococcus gobiensis TaxID=502394 RepID=UPI001D038306|nr:hypothetical protein [Deinococcus gobiensis]